MDVVGAVKDGYLVAKDVMKAAANVEGEDFTYHQSYWGIRRVFEDRAHKQSSYEMIGPYLQKFVSLNPGSKVGMEVDVDLNITQFFVCPGTMNASLQFVRPVMSFDACHLKSKWSGTLYVASVKSGQDNLYPVAMGIGRENENEAGWTWFLELLSSALEILTSDHPSVHVPYKYFSFVSDRQKGLINALKKVFPDNHSYFCAIHINKNAEKVAARGLKNLVYPLAKTFSKPKSKMLLDQIGAISVKGRKYLEEIPQNHW